jgi:hypothetical protein
MQRPRSVMAVSFYIMQRHQIAMALVMAVPQTTSHHIPGTKLPEFFVHPCFSVPKGNHGAPGWGHWRPRPRDVAV